ncbi:MAG TPA: hypothetical protein VLM11_19300, partial [Streptosporangiaceae bacterium]|nr:hypothetical protein [Streptosporangiaceae bacterium]
MPVTVPRLLDRQQRQRGYHNRAGHLHRVLRPHSPGSWTARSASRFRPGGPGRVSLERHEVAGPGRKHWLDDSPGFLGLIATDRKGTVSTEHGVQQLTIGRELGWFDLGRQGHRAKRSRAGTDAGQFEADVF